MRHNYAAIDSGCTTHTWPLTAPVQNIQKTASSAAINVKLSNDQIMAQSHHGTIPIPDMPSSSQEVKIFPDHTYKPLLSLGQLADSGYTFQGDHKHMMLTRPDHKNLCATRYPSSGMYLMYLTNPYSSPPPLTVPIITTLQACSTRFNKGTKYLANNAFAMVTKPDLGMYYHCTAFSPDPTKFISAINNGNFSTWPGLTAELISKHRPKSLATAKGHNKLARKNVRSTRPQDPTQDLPVSRTKTIQITVVEPSGLLSTDLTGRFPTISSRGYNYIIVCYIYDTNGIIVRPMKNCSVAEHISSID